jgi:adenine-specific DNA-methyltransferase
MPTLNWLTKNNDLKTAGKTAYRLLREIPELSAGDKDAGNINI